MLETAKGNKVKLDINSINCKEGSKLPNAPEIALPAIDVSHSL
jgi:hypothetical protein